MFLMGKLVVFEGIDGSGKKRHVELLKENLEQSGFRVATFSFPRYEHFYGQLIGKYLRGEFGDPDPVLISVLFAIDRLHAKNELLDALKENDFVLVDRYVPSNQAHQGARSDDWKWFVEFVEEKEYVVNRMPQPDLVIYLDVPVDVARERILKKGKRSYIEEKMDKHEKDAVYLARVKEIYDWLAQSRKWTRVVNDDLHRASREIFEKVIKLVKRE
ncbi:dTMP kinase [Candidatus Woesearchaeota archaeon]|nr:MAG: dTMP kinase [Candidatus Woesearchaeota archaeon]